MDNGRGNAIKLVNEQIDYKGENGYRDRRLLRRI